MNKGELKNRCNVLVNATSDAIDWVSEPINSERIGPSCNNVTENLKRINRRAKRLEAAVERNMSVAVFGPSQAGKSFLVSVLAKPENGNLMADYEGHQLDYINQINPAGEGESTGLVTRFTMNKTPTPEGYPVKLTLLTESDVICTLCNSFFMDGDGSEEIQNSDVIKNHLDKFRNHSEPTSLGLVSEEVWDIQEYINSRFKKSKYAGDLEPIWIELANIAPNVPRSERGNLFSILWGFHKPITNLYNRLATILDQIGHAETVHTGKDALDPKDKSIIDVKMLHKLSTDEQPDQIEIQFAEGKTQRVDKPALSALTRELNIPMKDLPHEIFKHTDLLDFPGARTREERNLADVFGTDGEKQISELFLRGKVAYLFDKYVEHQEVTSMLLCIPHSNMEIKGLPNLIDGWIASTVGASPEDRVNKENILFFVLTKFDIHLVKQPGSTITSRFDRRMQASLLERFGRMSNKWVENWTPGQPFNNCFWLRNPYYQGGKVYDYDSDGIELPRSEKSKEIEGYRIGYAKSKQVKRHFKDPDKAWEAAMEPNDGGVKYLIGEMSKVCREEIKPDQINSQLNMLTIEILDKLKPYFVEMEADKRRKQMGEKSDKCIKNLEDALNNKNFGKLISNLNVSQLNIRNAILKMPSNPTGPRNSRWETVKERRNSGNGGTQFEPNTKEFAVAKEAVRVWADQLSEFQESNHKDFGLSSEHATFLVHELEVGSRRYKLAFEISEKLKGLNFGHQEEQVPAEALICSDSINEFVAYLGHSPKSNGRSPEQNQSENSDLPNFSKGRLMKDTSDLPEEPIKTDEEYWEVWVLAFDYLVKENIPFEEGLDINVEQNERLGQILEEVRSAGAA